VKFDNYLIDQTKVNFIDDGPAASIDFDLAIREYDGMLKSNLNFRNPDAVKMLTTTSGLEELRGALHYQLMHKQILIVAVRMNQLLLDTHQRALSELEVAKKGFGVPNSIIDYKVLFCKTGDGFNNEQSSKERVRFMNNLSNVANVFYQVTAKKAKMRNTISKKFLTQLQAAAAQHRKPETCLRIMRAYKFKLLHAYCAEVLRDVYHDSMKIQALQTCQKLRDLSHIFSIDESVVGRLNMPNNKESAEVNIFKYEDSDFYENFTLHYNPNMGKDNHKMNQGAANQNQKKPAINLIKMDILDFSMIPSSMTIMKLDSITQEEAAWMADHYPNYLEPKGPA
jgi:hypothetical protein